MKQVTQGYTGVLQYISAIVFKRKKKLLVNNTLCEFDLISFESSGKYIFLLVHSICSANFTIPSQLLICF